MSAPTTQSFSAETGLRNVAVVTGAAEGIGRVTAEHLARAGYLVVAGDVQEQKITELAATNPENIVAFKVDVRNHKQVEALIARGAELGVLRGLVNNAAATHLVDKDGGADTFDPEVWQETVDTNLTAPLAAGAAFIQARRRQGATGSGVIVNVSASPKPEYRQHLNYTLTKAAMMALTEGQADFGAEEVYPVNLVLGGVLTDTFKAKVPPEVQGFIAGMTPVPGFAQPAEIAAKIVQLVDGEARFMSGNTMYYDLGLSRQTALGGAGMLQDRMAAQAAAAGQQA